MVKTIPLCEWAAHHLVPPAALNQSKICSRRNNRIRYGLFFFVFSRPLHVSVPLLRSLYRGLDPDPKFFGIREIAIAVLGNYFTLILMIIMTKSFETMFYSSKWQKWWVLAGKTISWCIVYVVIRSWKNFLNCTSTSWIHKVFVIWGGGINKGYPY